MNEPRRLALVRSAPARRERNLEEKVDAYTWWADLRDIRLEAQLRREARRAEEKP